MGKDPTASGMKKPSAIAEGHFIAGTPDGLRSHDLHLERVASLTRLDDRGMSVTG